MTAPVTSTEKQSGRIIGAVEAVGRTTRRWLEVVGAVFRVLVETALAVRDVKSWVPEFIPQASVR